MSAVFNAPMAFLVPIDKPPCPPSMTTSDMTNAPLDAGLTFNMAPDGVQLPTVPSQPAAVLSAPIEDRVVKPTQPQIPLHDKYTKEDKGLSPNRDQVYHIRGTGSVMIVYSVISPMLWHSPWKGQPEMSRFTFQTR